MHVIVIIVVGVLVLGLIGAVFQRVGDAWSSAFMRPFVGMFAIAALVAIIGVIVSIISPQFASGFMAAAKWLAVGTAIALCLRVIAEVFKGMVFRRSP